MVKSPMLHYKTMGISYILLFYPVNRVDRGVCTE